MLMHHFHAKPAEMWTAHPEHFDLLVDVNNNSTAIMLSGGVPAEDRDAVLQPRAARLLKSFNACIGVPVQALTPGCLSNLVNVLNTIMISVEYEQAQVPPELREAIEIALTPFAVPPDPEPAAQKNSLLLAVGNDIP